ncbi:MAG: nucleotidyl transferase AbiEii/AbiGii toxin family protein [Bacteroidales bacterium]|nr:nucleotidyl transferase AbiEii/AbiGii toxin family protein [Bacteroidales bacterium]MDT8374716.1 nucleotidyl transferase AbiEii/AbiGii toxin family protein [Bacteroidales bacterium]
MIQINDLKNYYPPLVRDNQMFDRYILKEYLQLLILDYLSATSWIRKITLIGGTCLRLLKGIDRFSEDLDFDCKELSAEEFVKMTDEILTLLHRNGFTVEPRDKENKRLKSFRRNIYFPELLFNLGLTGHREERFLIKVESQDQKFNYSPFLANIRGSGFFFPFPVPPDPILCAMKISAMLDRQKGRDFYDAMFLLGQTTPDYTFLSSKHSISGPDELKEAMEKVVKSVDLRKKSRDFEHLLFNRDNNLRILRASEFFMAILNS